MTRVGFKGFRKPEAISDKALTDSIERVGDASLYVLYTGGTYKRRRNSLRSQALATITEKGKPIALNTVIEWAARATGKASGFDPSTVKGGIMLHQGAKPACYLALEKDDKGNYRALKNIPTPDPAFSPKSIKQGDIVIKATK